MNEDGTNLPDLVAGLLRSEAYAHGPATIELHQTHISWVFFAGNVVFKVKKPVRFAFLDYSTLERRLFACREEVRLNRRLAPDVYDGAVPIFRGAGGFRVSPRRDAEGHDAVVEYAVRMRRLPADRMLDVVLREGQAGSDEVQAVARRIAAFHTTTSTEKAALFGSPEAIAAKIREDVAEMGGKLGPWLPERELRDLEDFYRGFVDRERSLLERRLRNGRIREGHGDLRAEHICLTDPIDVFDCVEFSERLRYGDVASEIAFLVMDLDFLGETLLARELIEAYARETRDEELPRLMPLYGSQRAFVRGKVETLKSLEPEVRPAERARARLRARRYFRLARRFARGGYRPALVVVCGPAGTGKTTTARLIAAETGYPLRRSDVVRKRLAGIRTTDRGSSGFGEGIYTAEWSRRTYERLADEAAGLLRGGTGAIVEATFLAPADRRPFLALARAFGVPGLFVECRAAEEIVLRRLEARKTDPGETSDAGREVYLRQREAFLPLDDVPGGRQLVVDTETGIDSLPDRIAAALRAT